MSYLIVRDNQPLGTSELEYRAANMGIAFGKFAPLAPYQKVRPVFLLFTEALSESGEVRDEHKLAEYYAARDRLGLTLASADGASIPTGSIHLVDFGEGEGVQMEVEVQVMDPQFFSHQA